MVRDCEGRVFFHGEKDVKENQNKKKDSEYS